MTSSTKTVAFLGASTGVGLSALKHTLRAGHRCIALCRVPSKLTTIFPAETTPNLQVIQGNAHDVAAVSACIQTADGQLVDDIVSTIGGKPAMSKTFLDDPEVCQKGMATLLEAIAGLRRRGAAGRPRIVAFGTTGMSRFGRDVPLAMVPFYHVVLKVPHRDKIIMEDRLVGSGEAFTIIHASFLVNGETTKTVRVGIEDPVTGRESQAVGYTISREDAGRWVAQNLVLENDRRYVNKIAMITY